MDSTQTDKDRCCAAVWDKSVRGFKQCKNRHSEEVVVDLNPGYAAPAVEASIRVCGVHARYVTRAYRVLSVALDNPDPPSFWNRGFRIGRAVMHRKAG
jgi:hypothetical protein